MKEVSKEKNTYPQTTVHVTSCSKNVTDDAEGWELTIASQILSHGLRWEDPKLQPHHCSPVRVSVIDSSIQKSNKVEILNDVELMQRCWDEKWTWNQFEQAMGLQGWEYNPVLIDDQSKGIAGDHQHQTPHPIEDRIIHPRVQVGPDAWQKSRLLYDLGPPQARDQATGPHLATAPKQPDTPALLSPWAPAISAALTSEAVTALHSTDFYNDSVYWVDGVSYAYSVSTPRTSRENGRVSFSPSPDLDISNLDSLTPVLRPGDATAMQTLCTGGDSQSYSQVLTTKKASLTAKKVILRIHRQGPPPTPPTPPQPEAFNQGHDHTQKYEPKTESAPPASPSYAELLYAESIPPIDWVLGDQPYVDIFGAAGFEQPSDIGVHIPETPATFVDDDDRTPGMDMLADQAWELWVNTIGCVPSIQRAMNPLNTPIPIGNEEQHQTTSVSETSYILPQELEPQINLPPLNIIIWDILHQSAQSENYQTANYEAAAAKVEQLLPLDLEEGEIAVTLDLEEGEIFEAQPPKAPSDFDRAFEDCFASHLHTYAASTRRRERKRRCIRPDEAFGERNNGGRGNGSQALASLAAQYADSDGEQQFKATPGARHGNRSRA